jgi:hypothetical protein
MLIEEVKDRLGVDLSEYNMLPIGNSTEDLAQSVVEDVEKLRASPLISPNVIIAGYVYDTQVSVTDPRPSLHSLEHVSHAWLFFVSRLNAHCATSFCCHLPLRCGVCLAGFIGVPHRCELSRKVWVSFG